MCGTLARKLLGKLASHVRECGFKAKRHSPFHLLANAHLCRQQVGDGLIAEAPDTPLGGAELSFRLLGSI